MSESTGIVIEPREDVVLATVECARMEDEHARDMQEKVSAAAQQAPGLAVVLDLSKVTILPSLSIGALVALWQKFKQEQRRLVLVGLGPMVRETLTTCRLDKLFDICDSVDEALSRIRET